VLQSCGYLNPYLGVVSQDWRMVNSTSRRLANGAFRVSRKGNKYSIISPYWVTNSPFLSRTRRNFPILQERRSGVLGPLYKIRKLKIGMPPPDIRKRYDEHSQTFKDNLLVTSEIDIRVEESLKSQKDLKAIGFDTVAQEVRDNLGEYMTPNRSYKNQMRLNVDLIRHKHGLTYRDAQLIKSLIESKQ